MLVRATLGHPNNMSTIGHVGGPIACVEIALYIVPEMGYCSEDVTHHRISCYGRGEVCIHGPNVFHGYYIDHLVTKKKTIDNLFDFCKKTLIGREKPF